MAKTIQEQIADMEARCNQLEELQKLFEKMVKWWIMVFQSYM